MVTIKEIAKAVGVSSATVSRVLNYDASLSITPAKRQAVIETAEALNYATPRNRNRATPLQRVQRMVDMPRLAIVHFLDPSEELTDPYFIGVRLGIESRCRDYGTEVVKIFHSQIREQPALLRSATGVIAIGRHSRAEIDWLADNSHHLVFADFMPRREDLDCVFCDLGLATRKILDGLHAAGYRKIAFIGGQDPVSADGQKFGEKRCAAYRSWHAERGRLDERLLALADAGDQSQNLRLEMGYEQAKLILPERPDAIIAANDNMAIGAYRAIQELGLAIPGDIAVVSYNDIPVAQFLNPPLSTIRILSEAIGETAVDLLVERINGRDYPKHVAIPSEMVWRGSSRQP